MQLVERGDPYGGAENSPQTLLIQEAVERVPEYTFRKFVQGRLISSFIDWREFLVASGDPDLIQAVGQAEAIYNKKFCRMLKRSYIEYQSAISLWDRIGISTDRPHYFSQGGLSILRDDIARHEPELMRSQIVMDTDKMPKPVDIAGLFESYFSLCQYYPWAAFRELTNIPYGAVLKKPHHGLPVEIRAGDMRWEHAFDRYYVPSHVRAPRYRRNYFDFLAQKYEQESDMKIKRGVFAGLYNLMPGQNISVLDAACGSGLGFAYRPVNRISTMVGVDESAQMVEMARHAGEDARLGRIEDAAQILEGRTFDYVMASFWDYWESEIDKPAVFSELKEVLRPGGKLVFNVHKPQEGWEEKYRKMLLKCGYTTVTFSQEQIERTGGGWYTAYYVVAEV